MKIINDKVICVTGGTGSFGKTVTKRLISSNVKEIRIFSRDELKQHELRNEIKDERVKFYIGDVRDYDSVDRVFKGVDYIFHAAALKQVPSCEFFPIEAVRTNVIGSENVIKAACSNNVQKLVCLSTDKAVYPINAMGMTKALMEKVAISAARMKTNNDIDINCVRYGNVMYSRGSVIPLFVDQIKKNIPITITNPKMTRFMMPLSDAVDLVLFAFEHGNNGELYVKKAPSCTIEILAKSVSKLLKVEPNIKIIGTRHGEKLYESLLSAEEFIKAKDLGDFYSVPLDNRDLNYEKYFTKGNEVVTPEDYNSHNTNILKESEMYELLQTLPEFKNL